MKRKIISVLFAAVLTASLLSGCGETGDKPRNAYVPAEQDISKLSFGKYNWPVDQAIDYTKPYNKRFDGLSFTFISGATGSDLPEGMTFEENTLTWRLEARTGLKAKLLWNAGGGAYTQKKGQAITSGEIPDFMTVSLNEYKILVKGDMIADLTDELLNGDHPTIKEIYAMRNNEALEAIKINGRIYGIPVVGASYDGAPVIWIRKDWLKKLNLDEPEDLNDLEEIALAFMERDPDGNGKNDTYGLPITASYGCIGGEANISTLIMNLGDGAAPGTWQKQEDGTMIFGSLMSGVKDALTVLHDWYDKGIIPDDFATWSGTDVAGVITNGQAGICLGPWYCGAGTIYDSICLHPEAEWTAYTLPKEKGGKVYGVEGDCINAIYVVRKDFPYPEAFVYAYDMIESFGNNYNSDAPDPGFTFSQCEGYKVVSEGYNPLGSPVRPDYYTGPVNAVYEKVEQAGGFSSIKSVADLKACVEGKVDEKWIENRIEKALYPAFEVIAAELTGKNPREAVYQGEYSKDQSFDANLTYQYYLLYWVGPKATAAANPIGVSTKFIGDTPSMTTYSNLLAKFEKQEYSKMIMGETDGKSVAAYFDDFVKSYLDQGGAVLTKEVTDAVNNR